MEIDFSHCIIIPYPENVTSLELNFGKMNSPEETSRLLKEMDALRNKMRLKTQTAEVQLKDTKLYMGYLVDFIASVRLQQHIKIPSTANFYEWQSFMTQDRKATCKCIYGELLMCCVRIAAIRFNMACNNVKLKKMDEAKKGYVSAAKWFHAGGIVANMWQGQRSQEFTDISMMAYAQLACACYESLTIMSLKRISAPVYQFAAEEFNKAHAYLMTACIEKTRIGVPIISQYQLLCKHAVKQIVLTKFNAENIDTWCPAEGIAMTHHLADFFEQLEPPDPMNEVAPLRYANGLKFKENQREVEKHPAITMQRISELFPIPASKAPPSVYETAYKKAKLMTDKYPLVSTRFIFNCYIK